MIEFLRYNMRSQIFAKSLPLPLVVGALKRIELMRNHPEYREKLWEITRALQSGLVEAGFDIGVTNSPVTPVYMNGSIPEATNLIIDLRENIRRGRSQLTRGTKNIRPPDVSIKVKKIK